MFSWTNRKVLITDEYAIVQQLEGELINNQILRVKEYENSQTSAKSKECGSQCGHLASLSFMEAHI